MKWQLNTIMPKQFFFASGNAKETKETVEYTSGHLEHTGNVQRGYKSVETSDKREENTTHN